MGQGGNEIGRKKSGNRMSRKKMYQPKKQKNYPLFPALALAPPLAADNPKGGDNNTGRLQDLPQDTSAGTTLPDNFTISLEGAIQRIIIHRSSDIHTGTTRSIIIQRSNNISGYLKIVVHSLGRAAGAHHE